ncbi:transcriptional repressor LexA [Paraclostridium sordellii]|uniref:transcriptional repressor LexA n=1 Tax=Paraclostridium sordellii TaxID=1505 RepID=UPI0005E5DAD5|nr:transcriptional repressor LexA [Paeniclostridium sordellii]CEN21240.1 SOS regulatory protein [[Clostridium] sordellii] [Paeniclostridium sordellii]
MYLDLTNKQIKILEFIKDMLSQKGYPPTVRELCSHLELKSTSTIHSHLNKLEKSGYIKRDPTKPRTIQLLKKENNIYSVNQEIIELPVIEFFENDLCIEENIIETIKLPSNMILGKDNFIYKVLDDKLIGIGILKNDCIIVDRTQKIKNGSLFMGKINNKIILGKYFRNENNIEIQFENCLLETLIVNTYELEIIGQIRGYFRILK